LSASLRPTKFKGDIWKLVCLQAYDRRTYPVLANNIITGNIKSYSMGAVAEDFCCSICNNRMQDDPCNHIHPAMYGKGKTPLTKFDIYDNQLAYTEAINIHGIEISALDPDITPAFPFAVAEKEQVIIL
jgi:hypothetical protein